VRDVEMTGDATADDTTSMDLPTSEKDPSGGGNDTTPEEILTENIWYEKFAKVLGDTGVVLGAGSGLMLLVRVVVQFCRKSKNRELLSLIGTIQVMSSTGQHTGYFSFGSGQIFNDVNSVFCEAIRKRNNCKYAVEIFVEDSEIGEQQNIDNLALGAPFTIHFFNTFFTRP
jgi:hypothetical protein